MIAVKVDLPYLSAEKSRHGKPRLYVRRFRRRILLTAEPGTPEFMHAYTEAVRELSGRAPVNAPALRQTPPHGSLAWLGSQYFASTEFRALDPQSQITRRQLLEECFREPHRPDDPEPMGNCPLVHMSAQKIMRLRDAKADLAGAANNRLKYLSAMFGWAVEATLLKANPARDVRRIKYATDGFHTWTPEEVRLFEARHPVGSKARLAFALMLFLGVRRGDVVMLGRQQVKGGWLRMVPRKTRYKRVRVSEKPILPELAAVLAASPVGDLTFLVTAYGRPFTAKGFGGWFRDRCNEAGLPHCTAHGLRKAGATIAAENGATLNQLMAIYDWETPAQAKPYTDAADRKRMAAEAMPLINKRSGRS